MDYICLHRHPVDCNNIGRSRDAPAHLTLVFPCIFRCSPCNSAPFFTDDSVLWLTAEVALRVCPGPRTASNQPREPRGLERSARTPHIDMQPLLSPRGPIRSDRCQRSETERQRDQRDRKERGRASKREREKEKASRDRIRTLHLCCSGSAAPLGLLFCDPVALSRQPLVGEREPTQREKEEKRDRERERER